MSALTIAELDARLERSIAIATNHRDAGDVLCWCDQWVPKDRQVDGTCGDRVCLHLENDDRKGLIP